MSQASQAIGSLAYECGVFSRSITIGHATPEAIKRVTAGWYKKGLAPATINKRLNCLSAMGVSVEGCRVREPKVLKWWLKPVDEERVCAWLRARDDFTDFTVANLIEWTTRTGLRVEESLRLKWSDFSQDRREVTVPGLKTSSAQATLPLSAEVTARLLYTSASNGPVFAIAYRDLLDVWSEVRAEFGWQDDATATLKALRRSAARHLHITKGMPLAMVQAYLRHEDIETTLGYLRLTGGYGTEEMRKWL
ncbi:tyrosine-type recombinase/integrase [Methylobacterium marchantiae]|uniref:Tyrosine-type recombinase/integrase n=1 Tax=Methylobacterium marchantiae TaxID=600331 RepID=A0ABW3X1K0_9HYPH